MYGSGAKGVADTLMKESAANGVTKDISVHEAQQLINKVFSYMPEAKDWIMNRRAMATRGEDCISALGRRRHFVMTSQDALNHIQNEYINTPIQSLASDFTMFALMEIHKQIKQYGLDATLVCTVHDSIMLEVNPEQIDQVANLCTDIMETLPKILLPDLQVPFKADAEYGPRWGGPMTPWVKGESK